MTAASTRGCSGARHILAIVHLPQACGLTATSNRFAKTMASAVAIPDVTPAAQQQTARRSSRTPAGLRLPRWGTRLGPCRWSPGHRRLHPRWAAPSSPVLHQDGRLRGGWRPPRRAEASSCKADGWNPATTDGVRGTEGDVGQCCVQERDTVRQTQSTIVDLELLFQ